VPASPGVLARLFRRIAIYFAARQSGLFYFLQKKFPVLKIPFTHFMTVNKNDLLVELLERDEDFTVEEINSEKMSDQKGAFFLGMDRMNPQFDRERNFVRRATKKDDLDMIRNFVRGAAEEVVNNAMPYGKLDVPNSLNHVVLVRLLAYYFGVSSPSEPKMKEWCSRLFYDLFLNFTNNKAKHQLAVEAAFERKTWTLQIIKERKQDLKDGKTLDDNLLNRLILQSLEPGNEWANDESLERNIGGLLTGILETTSKAVVFVLDELFRQPDALPGAIATAQSMDMKKMYAYVSEAMRFNPVQPGVIRYSESKKIISGKGDKNYTIPAKSKVFALTACAMFDPLAFPDPKKFDATREATYMNYGFGPHECYGKYINSVTISELTAALLRLKNVRREPGWAGRGTGLPLHSFPNNFVVRFDS
jgi:cytochrome P450